MQPSWQRTAAATAAPQQERQDQTVLPHTVRASSMPSTVILFPLDLTICCWPECSAGAEGSCTSGQPAVSSVSWFGRPGIQLSLLNVTFKLSRTLLSFFASCLVACEWHESYTSAVMFWLLFTIILLNINVFAFYLHVVSLLYFGQVLFILRVYVVSYTILF